MSRKGEPVFQAALTGSREIGFTILSMTLSLVAVFIPVLFMGGILRRILHEFAVTISMAILISGFVSLTLTPMLCSRFIRPAGAERHGRLYLLMERFFDKMLKTYEWTLKLVLKHRLTILVLTIILTVATGFLFTKIPMGFLPSEDTGQIFAFTEAAQGISFDDMVKHQKALAAIMSEDPYCRVYVRVGTSGVSVANNTGRMFMRLKPRSERTLSADEIIQELRPKVSQVPGIMMFMRESPRYPYRRHTDRKPDTSSHFRVLTRENFIGQPWNWKLRCGQCNNCQDVTSDLQINNPQVNIDINRDKASALGITRSQVEDALYYAYGSPSGIDHLCAQ